MNCIRATPASSTKSALLVLILLAALVAQISRSALPARAQPTAVVPVDVAAIALTPIDLEAAGLPGFGMGISVLGDPETAAQFLTVWRSDPDGTLSRALAAANPARVHMLYMGVPVRPDDPEALTLQSVFTYVLAFSDAAAATTGLEQLAAGWVIGNARPEPTTSRVGTDRRFFRENGTDPATGNPYARADLLFTFDRLVLGVSFQDVAGTPSEPLLDTLARRLADRAHLMRMLPEVGLSDQVVRIASPNGPDPWDVDRYGARGGTAFRLRLDTEQDYAERQATLDEFGILDYYFVNQILGPIAADADAVYSNGIRIFQDGAGAEEWEASRINALIEAGAVNLTQKTDAPILGDATSVYSYDNEVDGQLMSFWRVSVRVGTVVSTMFLRGSALPAWEAMEAIAAAEADCLKTGICAGPLPLPAVLEGA